MNLQIIILAAGQGKRMYSNIPKVLHQLAGKPLLSWVIDTAQQLNPAAIHVIYGHGGEYIKNSLPEAPVQWIHQAEQLGTGHAVLQAVPHIPHDSYVLILSADVPLIQPKTLKTLIESCATSTAYQSTLALLVAEPENPFGLGRIIRNTQGEIISIVEEKDAKEQQKNIKEIYTGICCAKGTDLAKWLPQLSTHNAQAEYYLTDIIGLAVQDGVKIKSVCAKDWIEIQGVNDRYQLNVLEREWQYRNCKKMLTAGVTVADARRLDVRGELSCGKDVFIDVNCVFSGSVILGDNCHIGPNCTLKDVRLGAGCTLLPNSVLEGCVIDNNCHIGPFARLRPGTQLGPDCRIGNFVETKQIIMDAGSKANHLTYLGDAKIGKKVNIGAGTITCNYDGVYKHKTIIEDGVFIGSGTELVAPVTIGANATIGAGSTIRKDAPADQLTIVESKQKTVYGWKKPVKKES